MKKINLLSVILISIIILFLFSCTQPNSPTGTIGLTIVEDIEAPMIYYNIPFGSEPYDGTIRIEMNVEDFSEISTLKYYINSELINTAIGWNSIGFFVNTANYNNFLTLEIEAKDVFGNISTIGPDTLLLTKPTIEIIENDVISDTNIGRMIFSESQNDIWLCTDNGLIKTTNMFDLWETYNTSNSGILDDQVYDIILNNNLLYVGTEHGLCSFDGTNWNEEYENFSILSLEKGNGDIIWIGTDTGIHRYNGLEFEYVQFGYENIYEIKLREDDTPFFATSDGLYGLHSNGNFFEITGYDDYHYSFDFSPNYHIWYIFNNQVQTRLFTTSGYRPANDIENHIGFAIRPRKVFVDSRNYVWVTTSTTSGGLLKFDGDLWTYYNHENTDLPECRFNYIVEDNIGNIIISSDGGKIIKLTL